MGRRRRFRNTASFWARPSVSAPRVRIVSGQSGQCRVLPALPNNRTDPDPSARRSTSPIVSVAASSISTTLNIYTHVVDASHRKAIEALERKLFPTVPKLPDGTKPADPATRDFRVA